MDMPQFDTDTQIGAKTIIMCAAVGVVTAIGAYLIRKDGQETVLHNVNFMLSQQECSCPPKSE